MARNAFAIIDDLKAGLAELRAALNPLAALAGSSPGRPKSSSRVRRKRRTRAVPAIKRNHKPISAKVRAQRVLQGRYLGAVRPLSKSDRGKVKQVQATKGYAAAIALAKKLKK